MFKKILILGMILAVVSLSAAFAGNEPYLISFQGKLDPVPSSPPTIHFELFANSDATTTTGWEETHPNVDVDAGGIFNILLGDGMSLKQVLFSNAGGVWLKITVDGTPLSPLQPLTAAPYAFVAYDLKEGIVEAYGRSPSGYGVAGYGEVGGGVYGYSSANFKAGVLGENNRADGYGIMGQSTNGFGVHGTSEASNKAGVYGVNNSANSYGVAGSSDNGTGVAGYSLNGYGIRGISGGVGIPAVYGVNEGIDGIGVAGASGGIGVSGTAVDADGIGVKGKANSGIGVEGSSTASGKAGVYGTNEAIDGIGVAGVGGGIGVKGEAPSGTGVFAKSVDGNAIFATSESASVPTIHIANNVEITQNQPESYGTALFIEKGKIRVPVKDHTGFQPPEGAVTGVVDINIGFTNNVGNSQEIRNRYITEDSQIFFTVKPQDQFDYPPPLFIHSQGVGTWGGYFRIGWGPTESAAYNTGTFRIYYLVVN
jgi:hypothetical protein